MIHQCHAHACRKPVPAHLVMCRDHWYMVPAAVRQLVWRFYRPGQERDKNATRAYLAAQRLAVAFVAEAEGHDAAARQLFEKSRYFANLAGSHVVDACHNAIEASRPREMR